MRIGLISLAKGSGCPPIGLVYLGTYLQKYTDVEVEIIDLNMGNSLRLPFSQYDLIGISAMTVHYGEAIKLGRIIKQTSKVPVVIGGVHISTCPESFEPEAFDAMVLGEGELAFVELVKSFKLGSTLAPIWKKDPIKTLQSLPLPNWDLIDPRYFKEAPNTTFGEFGIEGWLMTSRGCPYNCIFCSTKKMWGNPRFHSAPRVVEMIEDLAKRGVTHIQIWDDLFTINKPRLRDIIVRLSSTESSTLLSTKSKFKIKFNCQPRVDILDDEMCTILKDMGVTTCIFGFESGSNKTLRYLKNDTCTVEDNKSAVLTCRKNGLKVQGSVVFGAPGETQKEMFKTLDFMEWCYKAGVERLWAFYLTPFPGTSLWRNRELKNWDRLSHTNRPIFLHRNISERTWEQIEYFIKDYENKFKMNKAKSFLVNNPVKSILYGLTHIKDIIKGFRTHT